MTITSKRGRLWAAASAGVLLFTATGCGSSDDPAAATPQVSTGTTPGTTPENTPGDRTGRFPGADGKVAAVDGSTAQVQSQAGGQVAVTWNSATTFTKQVDASLADVKAGTCVMVQPTASQTSTDSTDGTEVTAASVRITAKSDGSCTGDGPGAFRGTPPEGAPEGMQPPDGAKPPGGDTNGDRPQVRGFGGAFGEVRAVSADGFTVASTVPRFAEGSQTPSTEEVTVTVTVDDDTTYTTTGTGSASDVEVGVCLRAEGDADSTGAITATTIAITPATAEGECGAMLFRRAAPGSGSADGASSTTRES